MIKYGMKVTNDVLESLDVSLCKSQVDRFNEAFPNGIELRLRNAFMLVRDHKIDASFALDGFANTVATTDMDEPHRIEHMSTSPFVFECDDGAPVKDSIRTDSYHLLPGVRRDVSLAIIDRTCDPADLKGAALRQWQELTLKGTSAAWVRFSKLMKERDASNA